MLFVRNVTHKSLAITPTQKRKKHGTGGLKMAKYIRAVEAAEKVVGIFKVPMADLVDIFSEIPAADVAPVVHGRWISWEEAGNFVPSPDRHECSVCHDAAQVLVNGFELLSDYCPNCGAKMDGGDSDAAD
jgi:hypothetical protein